MFRYIAFIVLIYLHTNASAAPSWFGANPFSYVGSSDPSGSSSTGDLSFSGLKTSFIAPGINDTTSGGWVSTGIQAVSGQALRFQKDLSKGIAINPYVYLVEYRADYRFDYPAVFIYTCNTSGTSCMPDYSSYSGLSSTTASSNTVSVLNNYFAMQNRGIPVYNGDLVNITYPNLTSSMTDIGSNSLSSTANTFNLLELNTKLGYYSDNTIFNMTADEFCQNAVAVSTDISSSCALDNGIYQYILSSSTSYNSNNVVGGIMPLSNYSIPSCNSSVGTYYIFLYNIIQNISGNSAYFTNTLYLTSLNNLIRNYLLLGGKFADIRAAYTSLTNKPSSIDQTSYPYLYQLANGSTSTDATLQTAALNTKLTYCLQDKGLGLEIDVGTTIIKDENTPFISFATSGITNYVYSFTSPADGLLGFRNTAKINSGSSYTFNNFDARLSTNTSSGVLNTAAYTLNTPKMNGFNFGRYLLEVRVGRGGNYLANVLPNLTYSYYIQPSGGSAPTSSTTGTIVPGFGQFAAPSTGIIWVKVASTDTNISGKAYMKVQSYTGSQVLSKGLNDYVIKPILNQFASVMRLIYDGPTGLVNNSVLIKIVKTAAILYVIIFAIYFLFGQIRITVEELVSRIVKITLTVNILFSSQSWTFFNTYLFDTILRGTNYLILVFTGQDATSMTPFTFLDPIFNTYTSSAFWGSIIAQLPQIWNGLTFMAIITVMGISVFLTAVFEVVMTYVLAFITIYILIGIAPLFIPLMLFSATSQFFYNWIKTLVKSMLVPVVFIVLILTFDTFIHQVLNSTIVSNHWGCLKQFSIHIPLGGKDLTFLENNPGFCLPFYIPNLTSSYNTGSKDILNTLQSFSATDLAATAMSGAQIITSNVSSLAGTFLVGYMTVIRAAFLYFTYAIVAKQLLKVTEDIVGKITGIEANVFSTAVGAMNQEIEKRQSQAQKVAGAVYNKTAGVLSKVGGQLSQGISQGIGFMKNSKFMAIRTLGTALGAINSTAKGATKLATGMGKGLNALGKFVLAKPSYDDDITQRAGRFVKGVVDAAKTTAWAAKTVVKTSVGATKFALKAAAYVARGALALGTLGGSEVAIWRIKKAIKNNFVKDYVNKYGGEALKGIYEKHEKDFKAKIEKEFGKKYEDMSADEKKIFDARVARRFKPLSHEESRKLLRQEAKIYAKERWSKVSASRLLNPFKLADEKRFGKFRDQFKDLHTAEGRAKYNEARAAYASEKGKERFSQVFSQKARDEKHFMQKYKGKFNDLHTVEGRAAMKAEAAKYAGEKAQGRSISSLIHGMTRGGKDEAAFLKANKANFKDLHTVEGRAALRSAAKDAATMQMEKRAVTKYLEKFGTNKTISFVSGKGGIERIREEALAYKQDQRQERSISGKLSKVFTQKGRLAAAFEKANKSQSNQQTIEGRATLREAAKQYAIENTLGRNSKAFFEHNKGSLKERLDSSDMKVRVAAKSELLQAAKSYSAGIRQDRAAEFKKSPIAAMGSWINEKRFGQSFEGSKAALNQKYQNEYMQGLIKDMGQSEDKKALVERALVEGKFDPKAQAEARLSKMSPAEIMKEALEDRVKVNQAKNQAIKAAASKFVSPLVSAGSYVGTGVYRFGGVLASPFIAGGSYIGQGVSRFSRAAGSTLASAGSYAGQKASGLANATMERVFALEGDAYSRKYLTKRYETKIKEAYIKEVGEKQYAIDFVSGKFLPKAKAEAEAMLKAMSAQEIRKEAAMLRWSEERQAINKHISEHKAWGGKILSSGMQSAKAGALTGVQMVKSSILRDVDNIVVGSYKGAVVANKFLDSALTAQVSTGLKLAGVLGGFALDSMAGPPSGLTKKQLDEWHEKRRNVLGGDLYDIFAKSDQSQMALVPGFNAKIGAAASISPAAGLYMMYRANQKLPDTPQSKMIALGLINPAAGLAYAAGYAANKAYTNLTEKGPSSEVSRSTPPNNSTKAFQLGGETYVLQSSRQSEPVLVKTSPDGSKGPAIMLKEGKNTLALGDQSVTINVSSQKDLLGRVSYATRIEYKNPSYLKAPEAGVFSYGPKIGGMTMPNTINVGGQERSVLSPYGKRLEDGLMGKATLSHTNIAGKTSVITEHAFRKVLPDIQGAALDMKEKRQRRLAQGMLKEVAEAGGKFQERKATEREAIDKLSLRAAAVAAKGKEFQERKAEERDKISKLSPIAAAAAAKGAQFTASSDRVQNALDQSKKAREESMKNSLSMRDNLLSDIRKGVELKKVGGDGRQASQERADFSMHKENMRGALADIPGAVLARRERLVQAAKAKKKFDKQVNEEIAKQKRREAHDKQVAQAAAKKEAVRSEAATKLQALARGHLVRGGIRKEIASYIEDTTTRSGQVVGSIRAANEALKGLNQNIDGADAFRRELGISAQGRDKQSLQELNQLTRDFGKARASFNELSGAQKDNALSALYRKDLHDRGQAMLDATSKYQAAAEQLSNRAQRANEQRLGVFEKYVGNIEGTSKGLVEQIQKDREMQNKLQARYEVLTKSKAGEVDKDTKELTQRVGQLSRNLEEANNRFNALTTDYRKTGQNQDKLIEAGREITKLKESYANDSALLTKQLEGRAQEAATIKLQALARGRAVRLDADKNARESIVNISARQNESADFRKALSLDTKAVSQNLSEGRNKQIAERNQEILGKLSAIEGQFKGDKDRFDALSGKQKEGALSAIEKVELGKLRERISQSDATYKSALEGLKEQSSNLQRLRKEDEYVNRITASVSNARGFKDETADIRKRITEERETLEIFKRGTTVSLDLKTDNLLKNLDKADADLKAARADITKLSELRKQRDLDEGERKALIQAGLKAAAAEKIYKEAASRSKELNQVRARLQEEREGARRNFEIGTKANIASIDERIERTANKAQELDSALRGLGRARGEGGAVVRTDETTNALQALNKEQVNLHKAQQDFSRLSEAAKTRNLSKEERKQLSTSLERIDAASKASYKAFENVHQESARVRDETKSALERAALAKQEAFEKGLQAKQQADRREAGQSIKSGIVENRAAALQGAKEQDKNRQEGAHRQAMSSALGDIRAKGERIERENEAATKIQGFVRDRAAIDDAKAQLAGLRAEKAAQDALKQTERENTAATKLQAAFRGFATREAVSERRTEDIIDRMSSNVDALKTMEKELKKEWGTLENNNLDTTSMRKGVNDLLTQLNNVRENFDSSLTTYDILSDKKKEGDLKSSDQKSLIDARKDLQASDKEYNDLLNKFKDQFSEIQGERKKATEKAMKDAESVYGGQDQFSAKTKTIQTREDVPRSVDVIPIKVEQKLEPVLTSASLTPNNQAPAKTTVIERTAISVEASARGSSASRSVSTAPAGTSLDLGRVEDQARPGSLTKSRSAILTEANDALGSGRVGDVGEALRKARDSNDVDKILRATEEGINRYNKLKEMIANVELNEKEQKELKAADERAKRAGNTLKSVRKGLDPNAKSQDRETKSSAMKKGLLAYENNLEMNKAIEGIIERLARESKKKK